MILDWWNAYLDWAMSADGKAILTTAVIPFVAVLIAGLSGAMLARGGIARLTARQDRDQRAAVIAAALASIRRSGAWGQLSLSEQDHLDFRVSEAVAQIRMVPAEGAELAGEWAALKTRVIKQKSLVGAGTAESDIRDVEDWLIVWHRHPRRAAKHFAADLETLRYSAPQPAAYRDARDSGDLGGILHRVA